jgi:hypothetical protein
MSVPGRHSAEPDAASSHAELARVVRDYAGRLAAILVRVTGDSTPLKTWSRMRC